MPPISTYAVKSEALRYWRERRKLTLRQLGARIGRHPQGIRKLETEDGKRIGRIFAWQLADALDVRLSEITDAPVEAEDPEAGVAEPEEAAA